MPADSPAPDGSSLVAFKETADDGATVQAGAAGAHGNWVDAAVSSADAVSELSAVSAANAVAQGGAAAVGNAGGDRAVGDGISSERGTVKHAEPDLLEQILEGMGAWASASAPSSVKLLRDLGREAAADEESFEEFRHLLARAVSRLDETISRQINRIIHHPKFQQLEASWRGLRYLVEHSDTEEGVKVRMLNVSWAELARDLSRALEFDQSVLFRKVYEDEFGMPGGEPFGVLIGDYQIRHQSSAEHRIDDVSALTAISQVAAAAFAPFIGAVHPSMLGVDQFSELERPLNLSRLFEQKEYLGWRSFRETPDARFVGLTLPHVLMRLPYEEGSDSTERFSFREEVNAPGGGNYLWGNAAYTFGAVLAQSYARSRWMADIRGVRRGEEGGGVVTGLPAPSFDTDAEGVALKFPTDIAITDLQERALSDLGLIPLCVCKDTEYCAFYGNQSAQKPKVYAEASATANARISAMLQYILCASRFAHYLKMIGRDKTGAMTDPYELSNYLSNWLVKYTLDDANASPEMKARYPLRGFEVNVREQPGKPGAYFCELLLLPHSQWDELSLGVRLVTDLKPIGLG